MSQKDSKAANAVPQDQSPGDARDPEQAETPSASVDNLDNQYSSEKARVLEQIEGMKKQIENYETDNLVLRLKLGLNERRSQQDMKQPEVMYKKEIDRLKEESAKTMEDKARMQGEIRKLRDRCNEERAKHDENENWSFKIKDQIKKMKTQVESTSATLEQVTSEVKELNDQKRSKDELIRQTEKLTFRLEQMQKARVEAQNLVKMKEDELKLQEKTQKAEADDVASGLELAIEERVRYYEENYELKLQMWTQEIFKENQDKLVEFGEELSDNFDVVEEGVKTEMEKVVDDLWELGIKCGIVERQLENADLDRAVYGLQIEAMGNAIPLLHANIEEIDCEIDPDSAHGLGEQK
ncbi:unnamed protein product [Orchesella dallaii]|uniref:Uncharacterized protein n=1 Tax=Orchesella dallaii TaxID=48710 RepID=A0ABP1RT52_9HEXA